MPESPKASDNETADDTEEGLTYADAGVDIEGSEAATAALLNAIGNVVETEYAGMIEVGGQYLALATDGVGTKLLVAEAIEEYSTIGIDCMAMNVNDLVAAGVDPVAFVDYLAVETPDAGVTEAIGEGLAVGAERADVALLGGETAVLPEVITGFDLAGACVGLADQDAIFPGEAVPGDALVGVPASGIHSNGLTLARQAITEEAGYDYTDPFPPGNNRTIGEELLTPTRIYTSLLGPLRDHGVHACAHITGGGWRNLSRMGNQHYVIDAPYNAPEIFEFVQDCGGVTDAEMHRTFNMGTGFVAAVPASQADSLATAVEGRVIGHVNDDTAEVTIRGLSL